MINSYSVVLVLNIIGGVASVGFGIWHLFVPRMWNWYSYIQKDATELIIAVRAINVFFSVSLILFGLMSGLLVLGKRSNRYSMVLIIGLISILWIIRVIMQIIYPQGSMNKNIQYGMLVSFITIFLCYAISLVLLLKGTIG